MVGEEDRGRQKWSRRIEGGRRGVGGGQREAEDIEVEEKGGET